MFIARALGLPTLIFSALLAGLPAGYAQNNAAPSRHNELLINRADDATASGETPGISVSLLMADGRRIDAVSGIADRSSHGSITPTTRFLAASIGKTATAMIAAELADEGVLDLDAPISTWLADQPFWGRLRNRNLITLRMLLNHTAGVPDYLEDIDFALAGLFRGERGYEPAELVGYVAGDTPTGTPGTEFAYSDTHYILVGLILEAVSGQEFHTLVRERVIEPLELSQTSVLAGRAYDELADGHERGLFGLARTAHNYRLNHNLDHEWAAGGLVTTPGDLAQLYAAIGAGSLKSVGARMRADPFVLNPERGTGYGLGLYVVDLGDGEFRLFHGGDFAGYRSAVVFDSRSGMALAVQANSKEFEAPGFVLTLLDELLELEP